MQKSTEPLVECAHCHQACEEKVYDEDKHHVFCCYGCKVVFELLGDEKRTIAYSSSKGYNYLDEESVKEKLLTFKQGQLEKVKIHLPQIHCSSCIYLLENLASIERGIVESKVNFTLKQAEILYKSDQLSLSRLASLLNYIGYQPDFKTKADTRKPNRKLVSKLGIAGFFFGNTMLLALPEYFEPDFLNEPSIKLFFRWLMVAFSLPVIFYSAQEYFQSAYKSIRAGVLGIDIPIALGISVLFIRSLYEIISGVGAGYFDSLAGLVFFLLLGKWYQQKTYRNFSFDRDYRSFLPLSAALIKDNGDEQAISVDKLRKGDKLIVRNGEIIPADGTLESAIAEMDYSYITGESMPVPIEASDKIFAGGKVVGQAIQIVLSSKVNQSYLASLWSKDDFKKEKKTTSLTDRISRYFTPLILLVALASAAIWSFYDTSKAVLVLTSVLIVACPCALALAEPFSNGSMMRWMGKFGLYLKSSSILNNLAEVDTIVFDKTGTLTEQNSVKVAWEGNELGELDKQIVKTIAQNSQHPLARTLNRFLEDIDAVPNSVLSFKEYPAEGVEVDTVRGFYILGKASFTNQQKAEEATSIYLLKDSACLGRFVFYHQLREDLATIIHHTKKDYAVALLSGDNTAEERRFRDLLGGSAELIFECAPADKMAYMEAKQKKGHKLLMLGDGLNDAGALKKSDIGISLCEKDVNFFPASDALLMADSFTQFPQFLQLSKYAKKLVHHAFILSFTYNLIGIGFAVAGLLSPLVSAILMPISSITVVVFTTLMAKRRALSLLKN